MTIDQLTAARTSVATSAQKTADDGSTAKADPLGQNAFMQLLLTQLQNQDPTSPQADGEFLAQLAQFSQLEQMQKMNEKLDSLVAVFSAITPTSTGRSSSGSTTGTSSSGATAGTSGSASGSTGSTSGATGTT